MLLLGLPPKPVMELACTALGFWEYQKKHENFFIKREMDRYRQKLRQQSEMMKEKDSRISNLMAEVEKLASEKQALKAEIAEELNQAKKLKMQIK